MLLFVPFSMKLLFAKGQKREKGKLFVCFFVKNFHRILNQNKSWALAGWRGGI